MGTNTHMQSLLITKDFTMKVQEISELTISPSPPKTIHLVILSVSNPPYHFGLQLPLGLPPSAPSCTLACLLTARVATLALSDSLLE
ncbi:hypothetical protein CICLE_v10002985mg [Citrus x clementina]|uniref:Uncharacterized protein n=1 Tax=Citrus clementina TaxID=85681 RepID=V4SEW6_CITCL|nr:hypothetical protein CICLE_v10002985mg [Citrus x clementina]